nr:hypothetical protein [Kofleriaceae bacterium]
MAVRLLPFVFSVLGAAACGHSPGKGLKPMVDTPMLPFKAPDSDAIGDITGVDPDDEAAILAGSGSAAGSAVTPASGSAGGQ